MDLREGEGMQLERAKKNLRKEKSQSKSASSMVAAQGPVR
jgi:hypothetical protein